MPKSPWIFLYSPPCGCSRQRSTALQRYPDFMLPRFSQSGVLSTVLTEGRAGGPMCRTLHSTAPEPHATKVHMRQRARLLASAIHLKPPQTRSAERLGLEGQRFLKVTRLFFASKRIATYLEHRSRTRCFCLVRWSPRPQLYGNESKARAPRPARTTLWYIIILETRALFHTLCGGLSRGGNMAKNSNAKVNQLRRLWRQARSWALAMLRALSFAFDPLPCKIH